MPQDGGGPGSPRVTVVVPTRDRPASLRRCLAALARQEPVPLEVIVADDGSRDAAAVRALVDSTPGARLIRLEGRGPAHARNAGADAAAGEVVCFTDDDCIPQPGWARALAAAALEHGVAGGRTVTPPSASPQVQATQAVIDHLQAWALVPGSPSPGFVPTCNLGVRRDVARSIRFDAAFPAAAGEDRDWSARALARGFPPARVEHAVVVHDIDGGTATFARRQFRYGRGSARFRSSVASGRGPFRFYLGLVRAGFRAGARVGCLVLAAQVMGVAGAAAERLSPAGGGRPSPRAAPR